MEYILYVSDSLGLPRPQNRVEYQDTVPCYLAKRANLWLFSRVGALVTHLEEEIIGLFGIVPPKFFKLAVIQLGLADCAPRPIAPHWRNKIRGMRPLFLQKIVVDLLHEYRPFIQKHFRYYQRTDFPIFQKSFTKLLVITSSLADRTIVILIPPVVDELEKHSPGFTEEITRYNQFMREAALSRNLEVIDATETFLMKPKLYLTQDAHLTVEGNKVILALLEERLHE